MDTTPGDVKCVTKHNPPSDGCASIPHAAFYLFKHAEREAAFEALQDAGVAEPTPEEIKERVKVRNSYKVPGTPGVH